MVSNRYSWCTTFVCLLSIILALAVVPSIAAQSSDVVHAVPRDVAAPKGSVATFPHETSINTHFKPLRLDVNLVVVPVTVTDVMNRPVTHLEKENFLVYEDNKQQVIRYFSKEDEPISVGLILDFSQSMSNKIETERNAVSEFFNAANPDDEYFAIAVSSRPKIISEPTRSHAYIESRLSSEIPQGGTALLDAIYLALSKTRSAHYQRRALLIISDGGDNNSRYRLKEIKSLAREADVQIYAIGLFDTALFKPFEQFMGRRWLQEITDATGGRTITVDNLQKLPDVAATISWELRNQYVLAYRSEKPLQDGRRRQIKVRAISSERSALQFHYKRSYFVADK